MSEQPTELFPAEAVAMDSPRLRWLKRHGITTKQHDWTGTDLEGSCEPTWQAFSRKAFRVQGLSCKYPVRWTTRGPLCDTEDEAIAAIAIAIGIKLWNEENA